MKKFKDLKVNDKVTINLSDEISKVEIVKINKLNDVHLELCINYKGKSYGIIVKNELPYGSFSINNQSGFIGIDKKNMKQVMYAQIDYKICLLKLEKMKVDEL